MSTIRENALHQTEVVNKICGLNFEARNEINNFFNLLAPNEVDDQDISAYFDDPECEDWEGLYF